MLLGWLLIVLFMGILLNMDKSKIDGQLILNKSKIDGHFADFRKVKNWFYSKTSLGENGCLGSLLPQLLPREAEGFLRGGSHSRHVPLLTYLASLQPIYYNPGFVFIQVINIFTCGVKFNKKVALLISSRELSSYKK